MLTQAVVNLVDLGMPPAEALAEARYHCEDESAVLVEKRMPADVRRLLEARGYQLEVADRVGTLAHVIAREAGGMKGATDPRGSGLAAAL